jgi:hypothetical protein
VIAIVVVAVLVLAGVATLWARIAASRAERRSVEGYGRALDKLGGVTRRFETGAHQPRESGEIGRPHVARASEHEPRVRPSVTPMTPAPRIKIRPPAPGGQMPVFSDPSLEDGSLEQLRPPSDGSPRPEQARELAVDEPTLVLPWVGDGQGGSGPILAPPVSDSGASSGASKEDDPLTMVLPAIGDVTPPGDPGWPEQAPREDEAASAGPDGHEARGETLLGAQPRVRAPFFFDDGAPSENVIDEPGSRDAKGGRSQRARRAATGAAAVVAIGALGAGGWQLAADAGGRGHPSAASRTSRGSRPALTPPSSTSASSASARGASGSTGSSTPTTAPQAAGRSGGVTAGMLQPTSTSTSLVVYEPPVSHYTITFSVTGSSPCWLGAQASPGGPYLWMQTVPPGGTTSYTANGPVVIRLGAPPVVSVAVNGMKVALPAGNVQPYDLSFTPSTRAA